MEVDNVIAAIGQFPLLECLDQDDKGKEIERTRWNSILTDDLQMNTNVPGIFAAGDGVLGAATVVEAIGTGRRAARAIHQFLNEEEITAPAGEVLDWRKVRTRTEIPHAYPGGERAKMPDIHVPERAGNFVEVELGLSEDSAVDEANRCLQCGLICYRHEGEELPTCHRKNV